MPKTKAASNISTQVLNSVEADLKKHPALLDYFRKNRHTLRGFTEQFTKNGLIYVFAFGSNLQRKQMDERTPGNHPLMRARLPGYALAFAGQSRSWGGPVATVVHAKGKEVLGALYVLTQPLVDILDQYEGYPRVYGREMVTVIGDDGKKYQALTYFHTQPPTRQPPSEAYRQAVNRGRAEWGYGPF